ncbi:MAG: hypothetical protein RL385_728 [Pseudomonadota bacterium]|jgi:hypothetical protein
MSTRSRSWSSTLYANAIVCASLSAVGCSSEGWSRTADAEEQSGVIVAKLQLPTGDTLASLSFTLRDAERRILRAGNVSLQRSGHGDFRVGALPFGDGYTLELTGTSAAGSSCAGTASFSVQSASVTSVSIALVCVDGAEEKPQRDLEVNLSVDSGVAETCSVITGLGGEPTEALFGGTVRLQGYTSGTASSHWELDGKLVTPPLSFDGPVDYVELICDRRGTLLPNFVVDDPRCAAAERASFEIACGPSTCGTVSIDALTPFGVRMAVSAVEPLNFAEVDTNAFPSFVDLYFPEGRAPGKPMLASAPNSGVLNQALLDGARNAEIVAPGACGTSFRGQLSGSADGLLGQKTYRRSTDYVYRDPTGVVAAELCSVGAIPTPRVSYFQPLVLDSGIVPTDPIQVNLDGAWDGHSPSDFRLGSTPLELVWTGGSQYQVQPVAGHAYPFGDHVLDLSSLHDPLGRSFAGSRTVRVMRPTDVATDLTFSAMPNAGAIVGGRSCEILAGALSCQASNFNSESGMLIGLAAPPNARLATVRHRARVEFAAELVSVSIVSSDAIATPVPGSGNFGIGSVMKDYEVTLQGTAPYYLSVDYHLNDRTSPCGFGTTPASATYELDEIRFTP